MQRVNRAASAIASTLLLVVAGAGGLATTASATTMNEIISQCQQSYASGGAFGSATIASPILVRDEQLVLDAPCILSFEQGGSLVLDNVSLTTKHLAIADAQANNGPTSVVLRGSVLRGPSAGLSITLRDRVDTVELVGSTVDYPLSVWIRITVFDDPTVANGVFVPVDPPVGQGGIGGSLLIEESTVKSLDQDSDGILFVLEGDAGSVALVDSQLETQLDTPLIVMAANCHIVRTPNLPAGCGS